MLYRAEYGENHDRRLSDVILEELDKLKESHFNKNLGFC